MKHVLSLLASVLLLFVVQLHAIDSELRSLAETEAAAIVQAREEARELAKDEREVELLSAEIMETAVADLGHKKVVFNRVPDSAEPDKTAIEPTEDPESVDQGSTLAELALAQGIAKPVLDITLTGQVDEHGISELWWDYKSNRYRIFTNADFRYFTGLGGFEDELKRYSVFMLVTTAYGSKEDSEWQPSAEDFSQDALEYYIMDSGESAEPDPAAFAGIEAMLAHYAAHEPEMRIAFENNQKIYAAAKAYREANSPKQRDVIINFRPVK